MILSNESYITDAEGNRIAVVLDLATYEQLLQAREELADIRAYDAAKAALATDEVIQLDQAISELESEWANDPAER